MQYTLHMTYAGGTMPITKAFVGSAIRVHAHVLSNTVASKWLAWCEENLLQGNPGAESVYALETVVSHAQTPPRIAWAVHGLTDLYRMKMITLGDFSVSKLRSYIQILNLKLELRDELLKRWLPSVGAPQPQVQKLQEVFEDFDAVRKF